ncbi:MAG: hypothetical protein ACI90U_002962 [Pseudomonadales bacterium]|jgi:hypothetical protein
MKLIAVFAIKKQLHLLYSKARIHSTCVAINKMRCSFERRG